MKKKEGIYVINRPIAFRTGNVYNVPRTRALYVYSIPKNY